MVIWNYLILCSFGDTVGWGKPYKSLLGLLFMADIGIPGMGGGLMRYKEEYNSKIKFGPGAVVGMIIVTIILVVGLRIFLGA